MRDTCRKGDTLQAQMHFYRSIHFFILDPSAANGSYGSDRTAWDIHRTGSIWGMSDTERYYRK